METIPKSGCKKIGFIRKTHGVRGEIVLEFDPAFDLSVERANRFLVEIDGLLVPFFVSNEEIRFKSFETAIISFDELKTEKQARRLTGSAVWLFLTEIIAEETTPGPAGFQNYHLLNAEGRDLGIITAVDDYSGNIVLTIEGPHGEILVPFNHDLLVKEDPMNQTLTLQIPNGLFE